MKRTLTVNGTEHEIEAPAEAPLLHVLRNVLNLTGAKYGCGMAQCGACTVLIGNEAVRSCVMPLSAVNAPITTIEGLGTPDKPHPVQRAFIEEQAAQCGYCTSGMVMQAVALIRSNPQPTEAQVRSALQGNLCRCGTHLRIIRALRRVAGGME
jgi:nicotinate dehydrogenase subunit A